VDLALEWLIGERESNPTISAAVAPRGMIVPVTWGNELLLRVLRLPAAATAAAAAALFTLTATLLAAAGVTAARAGTRLLGLGGDTLSEGER
jgi:hypothetical protein